MSDEKALQVWNFTESQQLLLREQARQHAAELVPFTQYQENSRNGLLLTFTKELNVPQGLPITVDLDNMQFIERLEAPAVPATVPVEEVVQDPVDEPVEV